MSVSFNPNSGLVIVGARLKGPKKVMGLRLALDTGATRTMVSAAAVTATGYDPFISTKRIQVTTASGVVFAPLVVVSTFRTLGQDELNFEVVAHTLPPSAQIDGLLDLDFFRDKELNIDFRAGLITLI